MYIYIYIYVYIYTHKYLYMFTYVAHPLLNGTRSVKSIPSVISAIPLIQGEGDIAPSPHEKKICHQLIIYTYMDI
jgi:hypothetical protein